jgi:hypothetical protein
MENKIKKNVPRHIIILTIVMVQFISSISYAQLVQKSASISRGKIEKISKKCQAGDQDACKELNDIALDYKNKDGIRIAAIDKITDQAILKNIILNFKHPSLIAEAAFNNITDQTILKDIAINSSDDDLKKLAVKKITDQTILRDIVINSSDDLKRLAVYKITDQAILKEIMLNGSCTSVHWSAVENLYDQDVLKEVAIKYNNPENLVYVTVLEKLIDVDSILIANILNQNPTQKIKCLLLSHEPCLNKILKRYYIKPFENEVKRDYKLNNRGWDYIIHTNYWVEIYINDNLFFKKKYEVPGGFSEHVYFNENTIRRESAYIDFDEICDTILSRVSTTDIQLILNESAFYDVRIRCIKRIVDPIILKEIVINDKYLKLRETATKRLEELNKN